MWIIEQIKKEPVLFQSLIQALLALLVGFEIIQLNQERMGLLLAFTAALLAWVTRQNVTPYQPNQDRSSGT